MKLTEHIQLKKTQQLSSLCHLSKNLYNLALYYVRQEFFSLGSWLRYYDLWWILKDKEAYNRLPSQTAQQTLRLVDNSWKSFFKSLREWKKHPQNYFGRPRPPKYKKKKSECLVVFTNQQCRIKEGYLYFPKKVGLSPLKTRIKCPFHCIRIIPKDSLYIVEIIYDKNELDLSLDKKRILGIDLGLKNIVTAVNNVGLKPFIIKGGVIKSINQYYNKQIAKYKSIKDKQEYAFETKRLQRFTQKRNNRLHNQFHNISRIIVNYCIENNIGTIIIWYNKTWKHKIRIGAVNTQNFVHIPFLKLVQQIHYKSKLVGIEVIKEKESFTSRCSFLDHETIGRRRCYAGRRISRGLFKTKSGVILNADVNAGYNILKKAVPKAFLVDGIEGVGLHPYSIAIS